MEHLWQGSRLHVLVSKKGGEAGEAEEVVIELMGEGNGAQVTVGVTGNSLIVTSAEEVESVPAFVVTKK